jgi:hypothetical protein
MTTAVPSFETPSPKLAGFAQATPLIESAAVDRQPIAQSGVALHCRRQTDMR